MSNVVSIIPSARFGYDFVEPRFLPTGKDEYYLRNLQSNSMEKHWRHLRSGEIEHLVRNDNTCSNWDDLLVNDPFDPSKICRNSFHGLVRIGSVQDALLQYHDFTVPEGITGSRIISCDIGDHCALHDCSYLSHYIIGDRVILHRVDEMQATDHAKFGNGIVKEGEDPDVQVTIHVMNEAGGRAVAPFEGMTCADAWIWAAFRDDVHLMDSMMRLTNNSCDLRRGWYGTVGDGCVIKSTATIKDVKFGPAAYVKGALKLKNLTIRSHADSPTQLGEGIELVNGIVGSGCHIFYGCKAIRFVIGENCSLKYGARLINSILGDNSTVSCCEVLNNLVFPGHEQHHNNSFLIASLVMGQSNMAAGATVGSNHNSRGNDGEIVAGRGFWPALSSTLKHDCKFASFTLLVKGSYPAELNIPLPFCLLSDNSRTQRRELMPAYWWMYNMYALERNSWKYQVRDKRRHAEQHIESQYLAPDTVQEILTGMELLQRWSAQAWNKAHADGAHYSDEELVRQGHDLLANEPKEVDALDVYGENLEHTRYAVKILKVSKGYGAYKDMALYYAARTIGTYCNQTHTSVHELQAPKQRMQWVNLGGQLVPVYKLEQLKQQVRGGELHCWDAVHDVYDQWWAEYPHDRAQDALQVARILLGHDELTAEDWQQMVDHVAATRTFIAKEVFKTKQKDYDNSFREITYRNLAERDAVLGKVHDNPFIAQSAIDGKAMNELMRSVEF